MKVLLLSLGMITIAENWAIWIAGAILAISVFYLGLNAKKKEKADAAHKDEHTKLTNCVEMDATHIDECKTRLTALEKTAEEKAEVDRNTLILLTQMKCVLKAMCTKLDIPASNYFDT